MIGSPIIYYGDEIGMGDNIWLNDRNGVRTPMQWTSSHSAGFSHSDSGKYYLPVINKQPFDPIHVNVTDQHKDPKSLLNTMKGFIATHKAHKAFGWGDFEWIDVQNKNVAAYTRSFQNERLIILNNLQDSDQVINLSIDLKKNVIDILTGQSIKMPVEVLSPYQYLWLSI
jgi:maltose alpha-D-glucosyltransferase/alpha-amylase